jgi:hypothetical protein
MTQDDARYAAVHLQQAQNLLGVWAYGQPMAPQSEADWDALAKGVLDEMDKARGWLLSANRRPKIEAIG